MTTGRAGFRALLRDATHGAWLGLLVLGVGGRAVMRGIALATGQAPALNVGGTLTVLAAGVGAGVAGALLHAVARAVAARVAGGRAWVRLAIFAALLALVTARGLHGSPAATAAWFWPLVALYGALFVRIVARSRPAMSTLADPHAAPELPAAR